MIQAYTDAYQRAQNAANQSYQPYTGNIVAPFTPLQNFGFQNVNQGRNDFFNYANAAQGLIAPGIQDPYASLAYQNIQNSTTPLYQEVGAFMSPYIQNVVDTTQAQFNNQNAIQQQGVIGNAVSQGAWGGDRSAVAQGIVAGQQALAQAPVIANLYNQGYGQALNAAEAQNQFYANAGNLFGNLGVQNANIANNAAALEAQIGGLGYNVDQGWLQDIMQQGALQQGESQAQLNVPYYQYQAGQSYPFQTAGFLANVAEGLGSGFGGTSSTTSPAPSTLSQVAGLGIGGVGLLGATGAFGSSGWLSGLFAKGGRVPRRAPGGIVPFGETVDSQDPFGGAIPTGATVPIGGNVPDLSLSVVPSGHGGNRTAGMLSAVTGGQTTTSRSSGSSGIGGILGPIASIGGLFFKTGGRIPHMQGGGGLFSPDSLPYEMGDGISVVPHFRMQPAKGIGLPKPPAPITPPQAGDSLQALLKAGRASGAFGQNGWLKDLFAGGGSGDFSGGGDEFGDWSPRDTDVGWVEPPAASPGYMKRGGIVGYDDGGDVIPLDDNAQSWIDAVGPQAFIDAKPIIPSDLDLVKRYESGGDYNVGYGGTDLSKAPLDGTGFPIWSGKQGPAGISHAAGAYQFEPETWAAYAKPLGITDFSPESQDAVAQAAYRDQGLSPWLPYNPRLADAVNSGDDTAQPVRVAQATGIAPSMTDAVPALVSDTGTGIVPSPDTSTDNLASLKKPGVNPWLALAAAGFAIAGGRSPNALQNIGAGALEGVKFLEQQRQSTPELRLKGAQAELAEAQADQMKALRAYWQGKAKSPQPVVDHLSNRIDQVKQEIAGSGETAAVPAGDHTVAPLPATSAPAPIATGNVPSPVDVPPMTPAERQVSAQVKAQISNLDAQIQQTRELLPFAVTPDAATRAQNTLATLIVRRSELLKEDPEYIRATKFGGAEAENPALIQRAGGEEAARAAAQPQTYVTSGTQGSTVERVAPRGQVESGTAPGMSATAPQSTAPATEAGRYDPAPESLVPTQPPAGHGVTKVNLTAAQTDKLANDAKEIAEYRQQAAQTPITLQRTKQLSNIIHGLNTGPLAEHGYELYRYAHAIGLDALIPKGFNPADIEEVNKLATSLVFEQLKAIGGRPMVQEIQGLQKANPSVALTPEANLAILANISAEAQFAQDRYLNASRVFSKYGQLGNFDQKYLESTPVGAIYEKNQQILGAVRKTAPEQAPMPGAFRAADGSWHIIQNGREYMLRPKAQ